jgi:hypothetical protein
VGGGEEPKFMRDAMYHDDIQGTRAKPLYEGKQAKDLMFNRDIEGTVTRAPLTSKNYDILDCRDINGKKKPVMWERDPLNPQYYYTRPNGEVVAYGEIEGSKPKLKLTRPEDISKNLN